MIGFVGRLVPEKGIEDVLAACEGIDASILAVGDGPLRDRVAARAHRAGAVAHEAMPEWYAAMDIVVVQDLFLNETAKYAHVFLPGSSFLEKNGTFTNELLPAAGD